MPADGGFHVPQKIEISGGPAGKRLHIEVHAICAERHKLPRVLRKRLALRLIVQMHVAAEFPPVHGITRISGAISWIPARNAPGRPGT